jgi:hypothetical protein
MDYIKMVKPIEPQITNIELQAYRDYVNKLVRENSDRLISNGLKEHAAVLISTLLSNAKKEIRIFSTKLKSEIWEEDEVISALKTTLEKQTINIKILLQEKPIEGNKFFELCKNSDKCEFKITKDKEVKSITEHFVTMDEEAYRYCPTTGKNEAVASFYDFDATKKLNDAFDILYKSDVQYQEHTSLSLA